MVLTSRSNCKSSIPMKHIHNEIWGKSKDATPNRIESILRSIDESYIQCADSFASQNVGLSQLKLLPPDDILTQMRVPPGDALVIWDALKCMNIFEISGDDECVDEVDKLKIKNKNEKHQCWWCFRN